jgi:hypothetical protein
VGIVIVVFFVELFVIVIRGHRDLFLFVIVIEAAVQIIVVVIMFIAEVMIVIGCSCVKLDGVVKHHCCCPLTALYFYRSLRCLISFDATIKFFTSWHEILATGCIQALPKASNLFHEEAYRVAFFFVLVVEVDLAAPELFLLAGLPAIDDAPVFEFALLLEP